MRHALATFGILALALQAASRVSAQEPTPEQISARIIATTVTVRATYPVVDPNGPAVPRPAVGVGLVPVPTQYGPVVGPQQPATNQPAATPSINPPANAANPADAKADPARPNLNIARPAAASRSGVAVASGVSLGHGMIVTFISAPGTARIRVTLPAEGGSAEARPVVVDHYSGLTLLEIDQTNLAFLSLVEKTPSIGSTVYTAAGSGTEEPMVSRGILSGTPRPMGSLLPPVLPCDVRTTASSSGAPLVDSSGKLVGIVAGADATGWAYAVPVQHIERLMKARPPKGVVVMERRQPVLGLNLRPGAAETPEQPPTVEVARVIPGGPSETAGFRVGDLVSEVDGKKVRILYDVSKIILSKQPGDRVDFSIRRGDAEVPLTLTLGGAAERPTAIAKLDERQRIGVAQPFAGSQRSVQVPSMVIATTTSNASGSGVSVTLVPNERNSGDRLLVGPPGVSNQAVSADPNLVKTGNEVDLLRIQVSKLQADLDRREREVSLLKLQLEGWAKALQAFQGRLQSRDAAQDATEKTLKEMEAELERLRKAR